VSLRPDQPLDTVAGNDFQLLVPGATANACLK
jgi:hypothetical protein